MNNSGMTSITHNGEKIDLRFGIIAVRMFLERVAASNTTMVLGETINETGLANLIQCGYVNNCMIIDVVPSKTLGFFLEFIELAYVDEDIKKQLTLVSKCYADSKYTKKITEQVTKTIDDTKKKKKSTGMQ